MITKLPESTDNALGFRVSGDVTKDDYDKVLIPDTQKAIDASGHIGMLLDVTDLHWEKVDAWSTDFHFGHDYHNKITRMAYVSPKQHKVLEDIGNKFYAKEFKYFDNDDDAWKWVRGA